MTLEEAIKKFQKGDKKVFGLIVQKLHKYVFKTSLKFLNSIEDAEDLTQEIFLKLFNTLPNFKFRSNIKTYIYRMVANSAFDHYKKESKLKESYPLIAEKFGLNEKLAEEIIFEKENLLILQNSIKSLPKKYKEIIYLKDFQNLSYKTISKKLEITENTAKLRHYYALKMLKSKLKNIK